MFNIVLSSFLSVADSVFPIEKKTLREEVYYKVVYYRPLPSSYSWPAPAALSVRPQPPTPKWTSRGGSLIFSFGISPFPYQKEVSMWTGTTSSVVPGSWLVRYNKLCSTWLLIGQNFVTDQSQARRNRACLTGLLIANLRIGWQYANMWSRATEEAG